MVYYVFIDMAKQSLEKILNSVLINEFPDIKKISVTETYVMGNLIFYNVYLGVKYNDLSNLNPTQITLRVGELSKYVLGKNERLEQVKFFDPEL